MSSTFWPRVSLIGLLSTTLPFFSPPRATLVANMTPLYFNGNMSPPFFVVFRVTNVWVSYYSHIWEAIRLVWPDSHWADDSNYSGIESRL